MRFVRFSLRWASNGKYGFTSDQPFHPVSANITTPDGMQGVTMLDPSDNTIYDTAGRKHPIAPRNSIYIQNGKKKK
jgi:hypothetical protein